MLRASAPGAGASGVLNPPALGPAGQIQAGLVPALFVMLLSGAAGLGWQVVWTAQFGAGLGHEIVAVLAVLAAFFGGLALGAWGLGRTIAASRRPGRWYAACEAVLVLWGLALSFLMPVLVEAGARLIGAEPSIGWHWTVAFALPLVLLLPASAAMGATLPALESQLRASHSRLGALYAANTLGAVLGLLAVVFVALPLWGLQHTAWLCAAANAACALIAWGLWRDSTVMPAAPAAESSAGWRLPGLLLATGLLGIGYEVLAVRVLSQVTENTVYSYALLLALYLLGTAAGAALYQRYLPRLGDAEQLRDRLLRWLALAVLLSGAGLRWADVLCAWPAAWLGPGAASALAGEALAAAAAMLAPTVVMGALFTHLCLQAQHQGWPLGRALAVNTAGAALAPALIGVWLLPAVGAHAVIALLVLAYLLLQWPAGWRRPQAVALAVAAALLVLALPPLRFIEIPEGGRLRSYRDGVMAAVSVVEDEDGVSRLRINNRVQEGSSASGLVEWRLAQLPLLLHPAPRRALLLGLGTGFTAAAAAQQAELQVDAVELLPEVVAATALFAQAPQAPRAARPVHVAAADARRYVQASGPAYDVVVADLFHPARSGAGSLYTVEQFAAVRARLAPGGLFCQWLAIHQMDLQTLRSIVAAFQQVFPNAIAVLTSNSLDTPVLGLVALPGDGRIDVDALRTRLAGVRGTPALAKGLATARLEDDYAIAGSAIAGAAALRRFASDAPANTDDRPVVNHRAPWATYAPESRPRERLMALIDGLVPDAAELLRQPQGPDGLRLQAYWQVRRQYLQFGTTVRPDPDPAVMLGRVEATLLDLLRQSPEFRPACDPLIALGRALVATEPQRVRELRATLDQLQVRCLRPS
ncbi:fused MFS/spermidine synthase [Variovorax terrae]|uniref:Fused MFS/spermidine synthase n=1 Tax=Variovorax terrae TaxID=2923278 RepID=A0A9X1VVZ6_9BURK|nr:fused MFS/spermidine synthase [Variovorax terrae]MCJ0763980.1 fused MFS/spermidine synthase [Variovorax terrae]